MRVFCAMCGEVVDPNAVGVHREQKGWSVNRRQGGSNQLSLRTETGRYAHGTCVSLSVKGIDPANQGSLM